MSYALSWKCLRQSGAPAPQHLWLPLWGIPAVKRAQRRGKTKIQNRFQGTRQLTDGSSAWDHDPQSVSSCLHLTHTHIPNDIPSLSFFFICSEFCHTLKWNSHGFTCVPHPDHPSHLPLHPLPLGLPSAPGPSACLMHPTWAGALFHPR